MDEYLQGEWEITEEDESYFQRLSAAAAEMKVADYLARSPQPLKEANQLLAEFKKEAVDGAAETYEEVIKGFGALNQGLPGLLQELDSDEALRVRREYERWMAFLLSISSTENFLDTVLKSGKSLQEAFFLSNETMSFFYQVGRRYLHHEAFDKASSLFFLLSHLNGSVFEFWLGLAIAYQELGEMEKAIKAYKNGQTIKEADPTVDLFMADCFLHLNVRGEAEEHLHLAKEKMNKSHEFAFLKPKFRQISKKLKTLG